MDKRSKSLRKLVLRMLDASRRGHLGSALSIIEIIRVLYDDILTYNPKNPKWSKRDRFILSKGHGCLALYALLADKNFFPPSELKKFCKIDGILGGHPEHHIPGIEASTGSLGHGLSIAVGMALYAKYQKAKHKVYALISDGELNEGSTWEAILSAAKHNLINLQILLDYNKMQSYGKSADILNLEPLTAKWHSFGFAVREVDGHDVKTLKKHLSIMPFSLNKPSVLICHTVKGKGISYIENNPEWHHKRGITDEEITKLYKAIEEYV